MKVNVELERPRVEFKKLREDAMLPSYATEGAAGFDFYAIEDYMVEPGETVLVKTGLAVAVPPGFEMQIRPRSGLALNKPYMVKNSPGTIDSDYRGEIGVIVYNPSSRHGTFRQLPIHRGERIAQGVICPVMRAEIVEVEELSPTVRGEGGFGSTGV